MCCNNQLSWLIQLQVIQQNQPSFVVVFIFRKYDTLWFAVYLKHVIYDIFLSFSLLISHNWQTKNGKQTLYWKGFKTKQNCKEWL